MSNLKKLKQEAFDLYRSLRKEKVFCPAFNAHVIFTLKGWYHLTKPEGHSRIPSDLIRRYKLLKYAKELIQKSSTIQNIKTTKGTTYYALEAVIPIEGGNSKILRKVRVIIVDTKSGKTFLSILDK